MARGRPGTGEVGITAFSVPQGSLDFWERRFTDRGVAGGRGEAAFGERRLSFEGPDGECLSLVEDKTNSRQAWTLGGISSDHAIRGFHSVSLRLRDGLAATELLKFMGYDPVETSGAVKRLAIPGGDGAGVIDIETLPGVPPAQQGAGSVHHVAFAVDNRQTQLDMRKALMDTGYQVTPVIDRNYFWSIYFRTPGGVLFEVATNEPGFDRDEEIAHLGEALMLPEQHAHLRPLLEARLPPLEGVIVNGPMCSDGRRRKQASGSEPEDTDAGRTIPCGRTFALKPG